MKRESGCYAPGSEYHPDAPWNGKEGPDMERLNIIKGMAKELEELLEQEDVLNDCLRDVRDLYEKINGVILDIEDGD